MERAKQKEGMRMGKNVGFQYRDRIIDIGLTVAALRKLKGYSQDDLAERAGISRQTLSLIETPTVVHSFSVETLLRLADALEVNAADLLNNTFPSGK